MQSDEEPSQTAEPAAGQVEVHFLAQPPFRADAIAVIHDQQAEHYLGIDRGSAGIAVERGMVIAKLAQIEQGVDLSKQVVLGDVIIQVKAHKTGHSGSAATDPSSALIFVGDHRQKLSHVAVSTGSFSTG